MLAKWEIIRYRRLFAISVWVLVVTGGSLGMSVGALMGHMLIGFFLGSAFASFLGMAIFLGTLLLLNEIKLQIARIDRGAIERQRSCKQSLEKIRELGEMNLRDPSKPNRFDPQSVFAPSNISKEPEQTAKVCPQLRQSSLIG